MYLGNRLYPHEDPRRCPNSAPALWLPGSALENQHEAAAFHYTLEIKYGTLGRWDDIGWLHGKRGVWSLVLAYFGIMARN